MSKRIENEGNSLIERTSRKKQLFIQKRFDRRLFLSTSSQRLLKICKVSTTRKTLPISVFMFWILLCTKRIKVVISVLRKLERVLKESVCSKGDIYFYDAESRVFHKQREICHSTLSENRVFGIDYWIKRNYSLLSLKKDYENSRTVSVVWFETSSFTERNLQSIAKLWYSAILVLPGPLYYRYL